MAAYWDVEKGEVITCESVDISIAVATEKVIFHHYYKLRLFCLFQFNHSTAKHIATGFDDSNSKEC